jgi:hypothetical protein
VPRGTQETVPGSPTGFAYRAITFYGVGFQPLRLPVGFVTSRGRCAFLRTVPTTPCVQRAHAFTYARFRLFPVRSPLLRESRLISLPPGTKMFQFPGFLLSGKFFLPEMFQLIVGTGFPIRRSRDHRMFAPPPGLSQLTTAFVHSPA